MSEWNGHHPISPLIAALITWLLAASCTSAWQTVDESPSRVLSEERIHRARLRVLGEGTQMIVRTPRVVGDSMIGTVEQIDGVWVEERRVALPVDKIVRMEIERRSTGDFVDRAAEIGAVTLGIGAGILILVSD